MEKEANEGMRGKISWPNVVTVSRLALVFVVVMLAYGNTFWNRILAAVFAVMVVIGDWLDGHLARRLGQSSALGSVLDIAADRVLESVLWIILADLDLVPVWIPIVVISRGIVTDSIRGYLLQFGYSGFGQKTMQQSRLGKFITGSPLMRSSYAVLKAFTFGWLLLLEALKEILLRKPYFEAVWMDTAFKIGYWAAVLAAIICIVRGVPVIVEGIALIRERDVAG
jgi:CDP-diacylglycerol--glycerol-3-phosphate 3-phosphatidyltransferase